MESVAKYIFEAGMLKRVARSGWWAEKIKHPESVADHCFRTGIIVFILARMEGKSEEIARKLCTAAVFHDMHETRVLDLNKISARYIDVKSLGKKVEQEQTKDLPDEIKKSVVGASELSDEEKTLLTDADYLECAFQAKEYLDVGYKGAGTWIANIRTRLKTDSAKKLLQHIEKQDSNSWWKGLKKCD